MDQLDRIDRSFPHRNQYGAHFFSYKENIFLIGGYGYWQTKSIITKFNFNSGDWELVNTKGQQPVGIDKEHILLITTSFMCLTLCLEKSIPKRKKK